MVFQSRRRRAWALITAGMVDVRFRISKVLINFGLYKRQRIS